MDYDVIVIGSGFGGSVAALRLSEKGYRVAVLEQGRRIGKEDLEKAKESPLHLFWMPALGLKEFFTQRFFRHVNIVGGVGVGGGSLVYAAVLLESVLNMSVTAHILGGCPIGADAEQGMIDTRHEVFVHPGLYVMDGSAIPANVGVNPSLTITAMAERAASLIPPK